MRRTVLPVVSLVVWLGVGACVAGAGLLEADKPVPEAGNPSLTEEEMGWIRAFLETEGAASGSVRPQAVPLTEARRFYASDAYAMLAARRRWFVRAGTLYNPSTRNYEWHDYDQPFVRIPLVITAEEASRRPGFWGWNRPAGAALYMSGRGAATFWLVQSDGGTMQYPVVVANANGTVDMTKAPEPMSLSRELQRAYWARIHEFEPVSDRIPILSSIPRCRERLAYAFGISIGTPGEEDGAGGDGDRVYFLGLGYRMNPYATLVLGFTSERKVAAGFSLDLGVFGIGE